MVNKLFDEAKKINDSESAAARKLFHKAYDELIEISATCINCSDYARRRHLASLFLGSYYFETKDFSTANFFFSKALNEIRGIDAENNNHAILVQAYLLEQISLAREEETQWIGNQFAMQPIYQPLELAKKLLEKAHFRDPNDGDIVSRLIKNSNQLRRVYTGAFNFEKAARVCEQAYSLFEQIVSNQFLADSSYGDLYSCQIQLIIHAKQNKLGNELALIERLTDVALRSKQISSREEFNWLSK